MDRVIAAAGSITDTDSETLANRALHAGVNEIVSEFRGATLERLNLGQVLKEFFAALRAHDIRYPADIMLLIKALTTIESVAHDLDPSFELLAQVRPFLERMVAARYTAAAMKGRIGAGVIEYLELAEDLPGELRPILTQIRRNKLTINIEHRGLDRITRTIEHASRNIAFALIIAAGCIGSSILVLAARDGGRTVHGSRHSRPRGGGGSDRRDDPFKLPRARGIVG